MTPVRLALLQRKWRILPDRQTNAFFQQQTAPGTYSSTALSAAFRRPKGVIEAEISKGAYVLDQCDWWIPKEVYPSHPLPGDQVAWTDPSQGGNVVYTVGKKGVEEVGALGTWLLHCERPAFNPALTHQVTVYRPQPGQDPGGGATKGNATTLAGPFAAALQQFSSFSPQGANVGEREEWGKRITPIPVRVYTPVSFRVQARDFLQDDQGLTYSIESDSEFGVLCRFMALDCFLIPKQ